MPFLRDARGVRARGDLSCLLVRYQLRLHPDARVLDCRRTRYITVRSSDIVGVRTGTVCRIIIELRQRHRAPVASTAEGSGLCAAGLLRADR